MPYAPAFKVTAVKDTADSGVTVITDITQRPGKATSGPVALALPATVLVLRAQAGPGRPATDRAGIVLGPQGRKADAA